MAMKREIGSSRVRVLLLATTLLTVAGIGSVTAADIGDLLRDMRDAGRVTRETTSIVKEIKSITNPTTSKRNDNLPKGGAEVVFYSASWCGYCNKARAYLDEHRVAYVEHDTERSDKGRDDFQALGGRGVPILLIGDERMDGWSESKFKRLHEKASASASKAGENQAGDRKDGPGVGDVLIAKIDNVAVHAGNSADAEIVARLKKDEEVVLMEARQGDLVKVQTSSAGGWVDARLLTSKPK